MKIKMIVFILFFTLFSSCSFQSSPSNDPQHKLEFAIHNIKTQVEELRQELNSHQMDLHILEGKFLNQDSSLALIREKNIEVEQLKLDKIIHRLDSFAKQISFLEKTQAAMHTGIQELHLHANDTTTALAQYKSRINELESLINERVKEFIAIRHDLEELARPIPQVYKKYRVQRGDTLKKIAKHANVSLEHLKELNHLHSDVIYVEQELLLPPSGITQEP